MRTDWIEKAREAKKRLFGKRYGGRETALLDAGWKDVNTVRRAIFAFDFLELAKRKHRNDYRVFRSAPFSIVELLARWHAFNPDGALQAARDWAQGTYSVRTLAAALEKARERETKPTTKELSAGRYKEAVAKAVRDHVASLVDGEVSEVKLNFKATKNTPPIDYYLKWYPQWPDASHFRTVAGIIIGPYSNASLYNKRRHEWVLKALGLNWFYDKVLLVLPNAIFFEEYNSSIKGFEKMAEPLTRTGRRPDVSVVVIKAADVGVKLTAEEEAALKSLSS